jgi:beta-glucanase (GH16 family)
VTNKFVVVIRSVSAVASLVFAFAAAANAQDWGKPEWSDEFDSHVSGAPPDASKWTFDVGGSGWGNHELEIYCAAGTSASSPPAECDAKYPNAYQDGQGHLIVEARRVSADPAPAGTWTSARMKTLGLKDVQYGRMESCMKLPVGAGLWPAFWLLGTGGKWPAGGEVDIMENVPVKEGSGGGLGPAKIESTIHGPSTAPRGLYSLSEAFTFPGGQRIDDSNLACHMYGAIWSPFMVQMYVDDWRKPYFIRTAADVPEKGRWVFNAPFYFLMNLAVGGDWPGAPDSTTPNPAEMVVDYVRVYKASRIPGPKMTAAPLKIQAGSGGDTTLQLNTTAGSGYVYLACAPETGVVSCLVDTENALNHSVVDFGASDSQTARVMVSTAGSAHGDGASVTSRVTITAYTVSGEQASIQIPVEMN